MFGLNISQTYGGKDHSPPHYWGGGGGGGGGEGERIAYMHPYAYSVHLHGL